MDGEGGRGDPRVFGVDGERGGIVDDGDWLRTLDTNTLYRYLEKAGEFVRPYIYAGYDGDMSLPMEPEPKKDPVPKYRETRWAKMLKGK